RRTRQRAPRKNQNPTRGRRSKKEGHQEESEKVMSVLSTLNWDGIRAHYDQRYAVHRRLLRLHELGDEALFARLLLGLDDGVANYSAVEHGLGKKILSTNADAATRVFRLATQFKSLQTGKDVPKLVKEGQLSYLG